MSRQVPEWKMNSSLPRCRGKGAHVRKGSVSLHGRGGGLGSAGFRDLCRRCASAGVWVTGVSGFMSALRKCRGLGQRSFGFGPVPGEKHACSQVRVRRSSGKAIASATTKS